MVRLRVRHVQPNEGPGQPQGIRQKLRTRTTLGYGIRERAIEGTRARANGGDLREAASTRRDAETTKQPESRDRGRTRLQARDFVRGHLQLFLPRANLEELRPGSVVGCHQMQVPVLRSAHPPSEQNTRKNNLFCENFLRNWNLNSCDLIMEPSLLSGSIYHNKNCKM